jgi:hypothetical protein
MDLGGRSENEEREQERYNGGASNPFADGGLPVRSTREARSE